MAELQASIKSLVLPRLSFKRDIHLHSTSGFFEAPNGCPLRVIRWSFDKGEIFVNFLDLVTGISNDINPQEIDFLLNTLLELRGDLLKVSAKRADSCRKFTIHLTSFGTVVCIMKMLKVKLNERIIHNGLVGFFDSFKNRPQWYQRRMYTFCAAFEMAYDWHNQQVFEVCGDCGRKDKSFVFFLCDRCEKTIHIGPFGCYSKLSVEDQMYQMLDENSSFVCSECIDRAMDVDDVTADLIDALDE
jgi:hypothetical protein